MHMGSKVHFRIQMRILNYYLQVTNAGEENVVNMGNTKELHAHLIIWKKLTTF
jgi:hypothetical protein